LIIKKKMPGCVPGIFLAEIYSRRCYNSSIGTQKELEMKKQAVKLVPPDSGSEAVFRGSKS
jgi:hypothetical protein